MEADGQGGFRFAHRAEPGAAWQHWPASGPQPEPACVAPDLSPLARLEPEPPWRKLWLEGPKAPRGYDDDEGGSSDVRSPRLRYGTPVVSALVRRQKSERAFTKPRAHFARFVKSFICSTGPPGTN